MHARHYASPERVTLVNIERQLAQAVLESGDVSCGEDCTAGWGNYIREEKIKPILAEVRAALGAEYTAKTTGRDT